MKKFKLFLATLTVMFVLGGCGQSLASKLVAGDGEWYLSADGNKTYEMKLTFESKEDVIMEMFGESESTTYSISKKENTETIVLNSPDDEEADPLELEVVKVDGDTIKIKISGNSGKLTKESIIEESEETSDEELEESTDSEEEIDNKSYSSDDEELYLEMLEEMENNGIEVDSYGFNTVKFVGQKNVDHDYFELQISYLSDEPHEAELFFEEDASYDDTLAFEIENNRMVEYYIEEKSDFDKLKTVLDAIGYSDKELIQFTGWYLEENM